MVVEAFLGRFNVFQRVNFFPVDWDLFISFEGGGELAARMSANYTLKRTTLHHL